MEVSVTTSDCPFCANYKMTAVLESIHIFDDSVVKHCNHGLYNIGTLKIYGAYIHEMYTNLGCMYRDASILMYCFIFLKDNLDVTFNY